MHSIYTYALLQSNRSILADCFTIALISFMPNVDQKLSL